MHITLATGGNRGSIYRVAKAPTDCTYKGVSHPRAHRHVGLMEQVDMAASKAAAEKRAGSSLVAGIRRLKLQ